MEYRVNEAVGCEQLALGCCAAASRPGLEPTTLGSPRPTPYRLATPSAEVEQNKCVGVAIATFDVWKRTMDRNNQSG